MSRQPKTRTSLNHPLVWAVTLARLLAACYILVNPFWGTVLSVIFDYLDGRFLLGLLEIKWLKYQLWDKVLDWLTYLAELAVTVRYGVFWPMLLLLAYRTVGQILLFKYQRTIFFVIFGNYFEMAFFWLLLFHPQIELIDLRAPQPWNILALFFLFKLFNELYLHYWWPLYGMKPWRRFMLRVFHRQPAVGKFFSSTNQ